MALTLREGTFWDFRWQYEEESCAQGSGCSSDADFGVFRVELGQAERIEDVVMYPLVISGRNLAGDDQIDLAPQWSHIGMDGDRLVASNGSGLVTIFDASAGAWTGSGFFGRFSATDEDHVASQSSVSQSDPFAEWLGVTEGPLIAVERSDSQSMCEIVEGRRICPNDESFTINERQLYREGVGPFGYTLSRTARFSGGGFFSSNSLTETVAVVAGTLLGDELQYAFEREPNQGYEQAEELPGFPYAVIASAHRYVDPYEILSLSDDLAFPGHDFFDIQTEGVENVTVTLTALSNTDTTLGFLVTSFDGESITVELISIEESGTQSAQLPVEEGKLYTVIVGAIEAPTGRTDYVLSVE